MERNVVYIAVFAALIAVLGLLPKFTLISGIPITAQSLGIMLCGTILGAKRGALAVLLPAQTQWQTFEAGEVFEVPADSRFKVKVLVDTAYLCTYGQ